MPDAKRRDAVALEAMPPAEELLAAKSHGMTWLAWRGAGKPPRKFQGAVKASGSGEKTGSGVRPWHPYRSKWEADYARTRLDVEKAAGLIRDYGYETERLEIGAGAFYTPDFPVTTLDGRKQYREVKGYRREAAMVRIRAAALRYPDREFVLVTKVNGQWRHTTIGAQP